METFYESKYITIKYEEERNILFTYWTTHELMSDEEYKEEFEIYEKSVIKYKPTSILVHSTEAKYVITVETQEWMMARINPLYETYNTKKVAVIMSKDFIAQLSFEQVVDEVESQSLQMLFFDDEEKGIEWLENKVDNSEKAA